MYQSSSCPGSPLELGTRSQYVPKIILRTTFRVTPLLPKQNALYTTQNKTQNYLRGVGKCTYTSAYLVHTGIGEEQSRVVHGHHRGGREGSVHVLALEVVDERLPYLIPCLFFIWRGGGGKGDAKIKGGGH